MEKSISRVDISAPPKNVLKRVAAYARVSCGKETMLHSLSAQVSYYSDYIQAHNDWQYMGVYADKAVTGTKSTREEFQQLLADCRAGNIDMVITKSISRLARNTVTLLETVRDLKNIGVDVYFEEQNIHTVSPDGELLLTILASYAQEESRSVSENCKWRIREGFKRGELYGMSSLYGYTIRMGHISVNYDQAAVVRMIFNDYVSGMGCDLIAKKLREKGAVCLRGGEWTEKRVLRILKNEKYVGNALLQKTYVLDHISKKKMTNKGELPMYYAEGTHAPIVDVDTFKTAQAQIAINREKNKAGLTPRGTYPFSGIITCAQCGKHYRRKSVKGKAVWICNTFNRFGKAECPSKQIPEDTLYALTSGVLGLDAFDEQVFKENIAAMRVPSANKVVFIFADGYEVEAEWRNRSRHESWTNEMRKLAGEVAKRAHMDRRHKHEPS